MLNEKELISYIPNLRKYARRLTKIDPEDLVQDTLEKAIKSNLDNSNGLLGPTLFCILKRTFYDNQKKITVRRKDIPNKVDYRYPNQEQTVALQELWKLPNANLVFAHALGYTYEEITKNTTNNKTTVFKRINKFRDSIN